MVNMTEQTGKILRGPWGKQLDRMSLDEFKNQVDPYLKNITIAREALQSISVFSPKGLAGIRPIQCRKIISVLNNVINNVHELHESLYKTETLPLIITSLRYRLLANLHCIESETELLIVLTDNFCTMYITQCPDIHWQQQRIHITFEKVMQHTATISQDLGFVVDEAKFYERKILNAGL
jgi:hypothetical protein